MLHVQNNDIRITNGKRSEELKGAFMTQSRAENN
jgi:hypothetical protein